MTEEKSLSWCFFFFFFFGRGVSEGETLGPALAENTGLTELSVRWNHLRGPGAIAFARGLEVQGPAQQAPLACPSGAGLPGTSPPPLAALQK